MTSVCADLMQRDRVLDRGMEGMEGDGGDLICSCFLPILLLETPCPSVGPSVRHVFYLHLTRMHTNLMSECAR